MRRIRTIGAVVFLILTVLLSACQEEGPTAVPFVPTLEPPVPSIPVATPSVKATLDPLGKGIMAARDAAVEFIRQYEPLAAVPAKLLWIGQNTTPEGLVGRSGYRFAAGDWVVTLQYPVIPEPEYEVTVINEATGFSWEGLVSSDGRIQPREAPVPEGVLSAHGSVLEHLNEEVALELPEADAWMAANTTPTGLVGSATYQLISGDWVVTVECPTGPRPSYEVRVWNKATGYDWEGTVEPAGEVRQTTTGDVQGWEGEVIPLCHIAQFDDFFERDDGERYGIEGADASVVDELMQAACGRFVIQVWGELSASVSDAGGRQIVVRRLEVIERPALPLVDEIPDGPVDGWAGVIRAECRASQFDDYFERDDGQRFGVEAEGGEAKEKVIAACCEELPVKLWGHMFLDEDYNERRIVVTRIEFGSN